MVKETYVQDQRDTPIMYNLLVDQGIPTAKCFPLKSAPHSYSLKLPNDNSMFVQNFLFGHELQLEEINARTELWYKIGKMIRQFHVVGSSDIFTNRKWKTEKFDITKVDEWFKRKYEVKHIQEFRKDELISRLEVLKQKSAELNTDEFLKGLIHDDWYTTCFILDDAQNITGLLDFNTAGMEFVVQDAFRDNHYWEDKQFADIFFEGYFATSPEYS